MDKTQALEYFCIESSFRVLYLNTLNSTYQPIYFILKNYGLDHTAFTRSSNSKSTKIFNN